MRDALFLLAHDEYRSMESRLFPPVLDAGLAAATLIDLLLLGRAHLNTSTGRVTPSARPVSGDVVTHAALETLQAHTPPQAGRRGELPRCHGSLTLPEAFAVLAPGLVERTRAHLVACGILHAHKRRFGRVRYALATSTTIGAAVTAPRIAILDHSYDPHGAALCALVQALQIHDALYLTDRTHLDPHLTDLVDQMRQMNPPMNAVPPITDALRQEADRLLLAAYR